jgi:hypothetical protein
MPHLDPQWMAPWVPWWPAVGPSMRAALRWGSEHSGLPVILVAAIALVASWRIFKRTVRFAVEVVIAVALLLCAARLGWIAW